MALSARSLTASANPEALPDYWHEAATTQIRASDLWRGERRLEAEAFLHEGYRIQKRFEEISGGWTRFGSLAPASAPPRIKQVLVAAGHGTPYLNTSQVFDPWPSPRKWLAMSKTNKASERLVESGTILVMASATVGRAIVATRAHENTVISHHFMRVTPQNPDQAGWIYAFLRSRYARAMIDATQYASVIRHIEPHHLNKLPIPTVSDDLALSFLAKSQEIVRCRDLANEKRAEAQDIFLSAVGSPQLKDREDGFSVSINSLKNRRRRFEAEYHSPIVRAIIDQFERYVELGDLCDGVWWGKRFKRNYGDAGIPYLSADDLFTTNRYYQQRILVKPDDGHESFFVKAGWLLMACSGQTYGLNGAVMLAGPEHENSFFSHDLIRIIPKSDVRPGYLLIALTHPVLGRPLLMREAYGMSIPHLDPDDVSKFPVVRLKTETENRIADLAEEAASLLTRATELETQIATEAEEIVLDFIGAY